MLCRRTKPLPIECVVRGYLSAPAGRTIAPPEKSAALRLPPGLRESDRLPEPIFTPSTKATTGHDENISFDEAVARIGAELAEKVRSSQPGNLPPRRRVRRAARHYSGGHQI